MLSIDSKVNDEIQTFFFHFYSKKESESEQEVEKFKTKPSFSEDDSKKICRQSGGLLDKIHSELHSELK